MSSLCEKILKPIKNLVKRIIQFIRRARIGNKHFSVISNNCWAGFLYRRFGMKYESPTAGLVIPPKDFFRFCDNLEHYLSIDVELLKIEDSVNNKFFVSLEKSHKRKMILGKVEDVEICFMHYTTFEDASAKWNRRRKRVQDPIIIKLNDNNGLTLSGVQEFDKLKSKYKTIFITCKQDFYDASNATMKFLVPYRLRDQDGVDDVKDMKVYDVVDIINNLVG